MYSAKQSKSDRTRFFDQSLLRLANEYRQVENHLKKAIGQGQIEVYYQPKFCARSERLAGVEALVRWNHPLQGLLSPAVFVPVAESCGLILELGHFVLETAIRQCAQFDREGNPIEVAINVSLAQLEQESFAADVVAIIDATRAPAEYIILEITESVASVNLKKIQEQMRPLRARGVKFSIDDFGTGYSNFSQILNLRFDELKIDRSLVQKVDVDPQYREAVRMIVALCETMGCRALAEGVETQAQLNIVRSIGCQEVQGFLFARPMPIERFRHWRANWSTDEDNSWQKERTLLLAS